MSLSRHSQLEELAQEYQQIKNNLTTTLEAYPKEFTNPEPAPGFLSRIFNFFGYQPEPLDWLTVEQVQWFQENLNNIFNMIDHNQMLIKKFQENQIVKEVRNKKAFIKRKDLEYSNQFELASNSILKMIAMIPSHDNFLRNNMFFLINMYESTLNLLKKEEFIASNTYRFFDAAYMQAATFPSQDFNNDKHTPS